MPVGIETARTRFGQSVRGLLGGQEASTRREPSPDGFFGPESVTRRVHGDPAMLIGGVRALLLQTLHPPTMAGVADHSDYRVDPLGRLHRTGRFVGTTTYGSRAEAQAAIDSVRAIHERVTGTLRDGTPYRANDPHLLRWVHVTEVDSFARAYRRYGNDALSPSDLDRYVSEMAAIGTGLGMTDAPETAAELRDAIDSYRPELAVGRNARRAVRFLTIPPLPLAARGPYAVLFGAAVGLLPGWARRLLWMPRLPLTEAVIVRGSATALLRVLGWVLRP